MDPIRSEEHVGKYVVILETTSLRRLLLRIPITLVLFVMNMLLQYDEVGDTIVSSWRQGSRRIVVTDSNTDELVWASRAFFSSPEGTFDEICRDLGILGLDGLNRKYPSGPLRMRRGSAGHPQLQHRRVRLARSEVRRRPTTQVHPPRAPRDQEDRPVPTAGPPPALLDLEPVQAGGVPGRRGGGQRHQP